MAMRVRKRTVGLLIAAAALLLVGGAGAAIAGGGDDDASERAITGTALDRARDAALAETGGAA